MISPAINPMTTAFVRRHEVRTGGDTYQTAQNTVEEHRKVQILVEYGVQQYRTDTSGRLPPNLWSPKRGEVSSGSADSTDPPLKPNQPNHRISTPAVAMGIL